MIELSDEMSPIDQVSEGDLDVVGGRVSEGALFIDSIMLYINPIVDYVAFEEAKG